ncbi:MAG: ABC transporter ATP-binding protein, partial [Synergistaceae bacterium]|nr:ABC transporter ATP-binding protein [Synergistaceae bacterium]
MLAAEGIEFHYRADRPILKGVSLTVGKGEVLCLLGPNGAGKTSLLRCLLGLVKAKNGNFFWEGGDMSRFSARKRAKLMAYVPQSTSLSFPYEVREVVLMGRVAHLAPGSAPNKEDRRLAREAMEEMNILDISQDIFQNLSGGQKQLVL